MTAAVDRVITAMSRMDEQDRKVIASLARLFAAEDRARIEAVQAALDAGDVERVRELVA